MIELLHARVQSQGVDVMTDARMTHIVVDDDPASTTHGTVTGIEVARPDGTVERIGCGALVLAAGGFAANAAMVRHYMPEAAQARCNGHEGNQGDAIRLGAQIGAALADMGAYQGYGMLTDPQGISVPPGVLFEGGLMVNALGHRFVSETRDIAGMVLQVLAQPGGVAWVIFDEHIEARCAHIPESRQLAELNAVRRGADAHSLARAIDVDGVALAASIGEAVAAQRAGRPDVLGRDWGDDLPPFECLRALKVCGALYHTQGGLQVDHEARVLRESGAVIPNVMAGGGSARGLSGPSSWAYLPAMGLCCAVTLGALAGRNATAMVRC
jgi:fumarate reductase flavoprotein subunit